MVWEPLVPDWISSFPKATLDRRDLKTSKASCILPLSQILSFPVPNHVWLVSPSCRRMGQGESLGAHLQKENRNSHKLTWQITS